MNKKTAIFIAIVTVTSLIIIQLTGSGLSNKSQNAIVSEEAYNYSGDEILEEKTEDWVSYYNPRDDFHPEFQENPETPVPSEVLESRPGSGKMCTTLLNEAGEPINGKSVENTTISIGTEGLEWHNFANPFNVTYPLSKNYEYPLDADQFGTSEEFPQGDGKLDSHCIEWHLESENMTLNYEKPIIKGKNKDKIKFKGLIQEYGSWNSNKDPLKDLKNFEEYQGKFNYPDGESHGQIVFVFQLEGVI